MKSTIWKFQLIITDTQPVKMPTGAFILDAQIQKGELCLWAQVDPEQPFELRYIDIYGTGNPLPEGGPLDYISTVQMNGGSLVWHIFERLA